MKIEIEVNPGEVGKSLKDILDTLPASDRLELARKAMEAWLRSPHDIERKAKEQQEVERLLRKDSWGRKETEAEVRSGYSFREAMQGWKSTKEQMVEKITQEITADYKAQVKAVIESDPTIQAMKEEVIKIVKETFPTMVHQAMVTFMASNMTMMLNSAMGVEQVAKQVEGMQSAVAQRLNEVESRVASRI
jgi:hypothetical protein